MPPITSPQRFNFHATQPTEEDENIFIYPVMDDNGAYVRHTDILPILRAVEVLGLQLENANRRLAKLVRQAVESRYTKELAMAENLDLKRQVMALSCRLEGSIAEIAIWEEMCLAQKAEVPPQVCSGCGYVLKYYDNGKPCPLCRKLEP